MSRSLASFLVLTDVLDDFAAILQGVPAASHLTHDPEAMGGGFWRHSCRRTYLNASFRRKENKGAKGKRASELRNLHLI
jgi:hypothetical protein